MNVGEAFVTLRPDTAGFEGEAKRNILGPLKSVVTAAAVLLAAKVGVDFLKGAIGNASNLNETVSKSRAIFGPASAELESWANTAASAIGQSKQQALDAVGTFGNLFVQLGIGSETAAGMSVEMTKLASDFASFHNADITEVLNAQSAAFRGEYDALQRFVPTINAAAVEQEALRESGKKTTKELTLQEKALATQTLMMKGAGDAAGDFARTSDGLANKQRIQSAQWADLTAKLGQGLLPVMTSVTGFIIDRLIPAIEKTSKFVADNKVYLLALAAGITAAVLPALIAWTVAATAAAAATLAAAAPAIATGAAIAALAAGLIYAYKHSETFRDVVDTSFRAVKKAVEVAWAVIKPILDVWQKELQLLWKAFDKIADIADKVGGIIKKIGGGIGGALGSVFGSSADLSIGTGDLSQPAVDQAFDSMFQPGGPLAGLDGISSDLLKLNGVNPADISSFGGWWENGLLHQGTVFMNDGTSRDFGHTTTQAEYEAMLAAANRPIVVQSVLDGQVIAETVVRATGLDMVGQGARSY